MSGQTRGQQDAIEARQEATGMTNVQENVRVVDATAPGRYVVAPPSQLPSDPTDRVLARRNARNARYAAMHAAHGLPTENFASGGGAPGCSAVTAATRSTTWLCFMVAPTRLMVSYGYG